jgi:hypothetical protein
MVLTKGVEADVAYDYKVPMRLLVADGEQGCGVFIVSREQLGVHAGDSLRGAHEALAGNVLSESSEQFLDGGLGAPMVDDAALGVICAHNDSVR